MKYRHTAVFAAALLLFCMTGCKGKPSTIAVPEQTAIPGAVTSAEPAPGDIVFPADTDEMPESLSGSETSADADTTIPSAASASVPAALEGELTPIQTEPTIPNNTKTTYPNAADDDQQGDYTPPPVTSPRVSKPDQPAATAAAPKDPPKDTPKDVPAETAAAGTPTALHTQGGAPGGMLQITVETVEITLDQLKAQDYQVDLHVTLDKNPGIVYSEWGLQLDEKCTYTADSDDLKFDTISFINDDANFLWTAWSSGGNATARTGALLTLHVTVPRDAKSGSVYIIRYAPESLAPAPHLWQNEDISYVAADEVGWTNGGILIK